MDFSIERAASNDAGALTAMYGELLSEIVTGMRGEFCFDSQRAEINLHRHIIDESYFIFVAQEEDGNRVGFIAVTEQNGSDRRADGLIASLYVKPQFRCKGIGTLLIQRIKKLRVQQGWDGICVTKAPGSGDERLLKFYESVGFSATTDHVYRLGRGTPVQSSFGVSSLVQHSY